MLFWSSDDVGLIVVERIAPGPADLYSFTRFSYLRMSSFLINVILTTWDAVSSQFPATVDVSSFKENKLAEQHAIFLICSNWEYQLNTNGQADD